MHITVRQPCVAGTFYPDDPATLRENIQDYLALANPPELEPKALVAPHAGYPYSGPVAAYAYKLLIPMAPRIRRVALLGPAHRVGFTGIALSHADYFATPLGRIRVDQDVLQTLTAQPLTGFADSAYAGEHSLEVHLPFLQTVLGDFALVPLLVGQIDIPAMVSMLEAVWGTDDTLVIVSSDLSHYLEYHQARRVDQHTTQAIEQLQTDAIHSHDACGRLPLCGLLEVARRKGLQVTTLDLRNSGDTAGSQARVVGYGAYAFH